MKRRNFEIIIGVSSLRPHSDSRTVHLLFHWMVLLLRYSSHHNAGVFYIANFRRPVFIVNEDGHLPRPRIRRDDSLPIPENRCPVIDATVVTRRPGAAPENYFFADAPSRRWPPVRSRRTIRISLIMLSAILAGESAPMSSLGGA